MITVPPPPSPSPPTWNVSRTTVRVAKPVALMFAKHPSVQVTRSRSDFYPSTITARGLSTSSIQSLPHTAFLGLGTNIGDRVKNLTNALQQLKAIGEGQIATVDSSYLYESEAMYHEDQDRFLNAAIKVNPFRVFPASSYLTLLTNTKDRDVIGTRRTIGRSEKGRKQTRTRFLDFS